jgi:integrase
MSYISSYYKPSTLRTARYIIKGQLLPALGDKPLDRINRSAILKWFEPFSRKAPGNANKSLKELSAILNHAIREGVISRNPAKRIQLNPGKIMTRFLSPEERARLLTVLDALPPRIRIYALFIKFLLFTGCRRNEALTLKFGDINLAGKVIHLRDSKTGPRKVWIGNEVVDIIKEAQALQNESGRILDFVFPNKRNPELHMGVSWIVWKKILQEAEIVDFRLHDLRHSFATEALRQGVPLPMLSKLMGHSSITVTARYAHVCDKDIMEAAERTGEHLTALLLGKVVQYS